MSRRLRDLGCGSVSESGARLGCEIRATVCFTDLHQGRSMNTREEPGAVETGQPRLMGGAKRQPEAGSGDDGLPGCPHCQAQPQGGQRHEGERES